MPQKRIDVAHSLPNNSFAASKPTRDEYVVNPRSKDSEEEMRSLLETLNKQIRRATDAIQTLSRLQPEQDEVTTVSRQRDPTSRFALIKQMRMWWKQYAPKSCSGSSGRSTQLSQAQYVLDELQSRQQQVTIVLARESVGGLSYERIPPEVWAVIFGFTLSGDQGYEQPNVHSGPLLLCRVCRQWKEITISTPRLWQSISISGTSRNHASPALLELWLQRSRNLPLSVEISISLHMQSPHESGNLNLIFSHSERWHRLRLNLADTLLLQSLLSTPIPNLEILELGSNHAIPILHLPCRSFPKLRTISLLTVPLDPSPLALPWSQLTHFSSRCWADINSHLNLLRRCPQLVQCRIHLFHAHAPPLDDLPLLMPDLRFLEIVAFTSDAMDAILDRLILPALSGLSLVVPDDSPSYGICRCSISTACNLAERSCCKGLLRVSLTGMTQILHDDTHDITTKAKKLLITQIITP